MGLSINIPITPSPSVSSTVATVKTVENATSNPSAVATNVIKSSIPALAAPSVNSLASSAGIPTSLKDITSTAGVPSLSNLASSTGLPTSFNSLAPANVPSLSSLAASSGIPTSLSGATSAIGLKLPQIPGFPGLGKAGIMLGAGPKFLAQTLPKYTSIVPPYVPGLTISFGTIAGALAIIKSLASANPTQFLNQLTAGFVGDLKGQASALLQTAKDTSGISDLQNQVSGIQGTVQAATSGNSLTSVAQEAGIPTTVAGAESDVGIPTTVSGVASAVDAGTSGTSGTSGTVEDDNSGDNQGG